MNVMKSILFPGLVGSLFVAGAIAGLSGCRASPAKKANENFFTSGSREADQRASQRKARVKGAARRGSRKRKLKNPTKVRRLRRLGVQQQMKLRRPPTNSPYTSALGDRRASRILWPILQSGRWTIRG